MKLRDGILQVVDRERIQLPDVPPTEQFQRWKGFRSHKGRTWFQVFRLLNENFGFYCRADTRVVESERYELYKEEEYPGFGGKNDIGIVEKDRDDIHDITANEYPDSSRVAHIEVGKLTTQNKVISGVLTAAEFWWAGPRKDHYDPSESWKVSDELWVFSLAASPEEALKYHSQSERIPLDKLSLQQLWDEPGLFS